MTSAKLSWGWNVALLYTLFAGMIIMLVVASSRQQVDLVSADYYKDEIAYQQVLDAGKNQAQLMGAVTVHANEHEVSVDFPAEFNTLIKSGQLQFYAAANKEWDYSLPLKTGDNSIAIPRDRLHNTRYVVKMSYEVEGKEYYYESNIDLHP